MLVWTASLAPSILIGALTYVLLRKTIDWALISRRVALALRLSRRGGNVRRMAGGADSLKESIGGFVSVLGRLMPLGAEDREKISANLNRAGYRSSNALTTVLGLKFSCLVGGLVLGMSMLSGLYPGLMGLLVGLVGGLLFGVLMNVLPEWILSRMATKRLRRINASMAETLDLLVVCLESGQTFGRALERTVANLKSFQPDLAKELGQAVLDMNVHGRTREEALTRLAERVDSQNFKDMATTVTQSERHGTPLADSLRKLAGSVRVETVSRMQEKMARLPTLLIVPSISCILPGIMVIVGGPAMLQLMNSFGSFGV